MKKQKGFEKREILKEFHHCYEFSDIICGSADIICDSIKAIEKKSFDRQSRIY
jgi:hypothetical protein